MTTAAAKLAVLQRAPSRVRIVTAASLFDGHDASINIIRRVLQRLGAEIIHLGHDRSVEEIVEAAVQEDAHAIAISSYQSQTSLMTILMVTSPPHSLGAATPLKFATSLSFT